MAKPNYKFQKKQREAQRLTRQAEKQQRRAASKSETETEQSALLPTTTAEVEPPKPAG